MNGNLSSHQFKVLDFNAAKRVKEATGRAAAIPMTTSESPEFEQHANEAMALGNPPKPKKSLFRKAADYLGIVE